MDIFEQRRSGMKNTKILFKLRKRIVLPVLGVELGVAPKFNFIPLDVVAGAGVLACVAGAPNPNPV